MSLHVLMSEFPELFMMILSKCDQATKFISQFVSRQFRITIQSKYKSCKKVNLFKYAAELGARNLLEWVVSLKYATELHDLDKVAVCGDLDTLKFLQNSMYSENIDDGVSILAASKNHLHILKWLLTVDGFKFSGYRDEIDIAINNGYFEMVKWIYENRYAMYAMYGPGDEIGGSETIPLMFIKSIASGNLELIQWIYFNTPGDHFFVEEYSPHEFDRVEYRDYSIVPSEEEYMKVLEWLDSIKFPFSKFTFTWAAEEGHMKIAKWLEEKKYPRSAFITIGAIANRRFEMLKWLHEELNCQLSHNGLCMAARTGDREIVKWLVSKGLKPYIQCVHEAASAGNFEMVKWLHEEFNCPVMDKIICEAAIHGRSLELIKWLVAKGCIFQKKACETAAEMNDLKIIKYLYSKKYVLTKIVCDIASRRGYLKILKWAIKNKCPYDKAACIVSANDWGHRNMVNYLNRL